MTSFSGLLRPILVPLVQFRVPAHSVIPESHRAMYYKDVCISEYISIYTHPYHPWAISFPTYLGSKPVGPAHPAAGLYPWQTYNCACSIFPVGIRSLMILLNIQVYHRDKKTPIHLLIACFAIRRYRSHPLISVLYQFRRSFLVLTFTQYLLSFPVIIIFTC